MHADRILKRCKAVDVVVNTVRNEDQARALEDVNRLIDGVVARVRDDVIAAKDVRVLLLTHAIFEGKKELGMGAKIFFL